MKFEIGTVLTLEDDKDYVISQTKMYKGSFYMLLVEMPDYKSFKYVRVIDEHNLAEIEDIELIEELSKQFVKKED